MTRSAPGTVIVNSMTSTPPSRSASITCRASSPDGARTTGMTPPAAIRSRVSRLAMIGPPWGREPAHVVLAVRGEHVEDDRLLQGARGVLDPSLEDEAVPRGCLELLVTAEELEPSADYVDHLIVRVRMSRSDPGGFHPVLDEHHLLVVRQDAALEAGFRGEELRVPRRDTHQVGEVSIGYIHGIHGKRCSSLEASS